MVSAKIDVPRQPVTGWSALRLLPLPIWITLLAVLAAILVIAVVGDRSGTLVAMTVISTALLVVVARLIAAEAARQESLRLTAEQQVAELEQMVELRTRELSELSTHLQKLAEKEKSELARNLHDELGGLLTAAKMDLSWLQSRLTEPAPYGARLTQLGTVLDEAMDLKRRVVEELRPSLLDHFGLPTALRAHVESVCEKADLQCEVMMAEDAESLPRDSAIALFRVVQEGLTNVVRHAQARQVRLALTSDAQCYLLVLIDDGCGMNLDDSRFRWSHGLTGMRHRVQALGGRFSIQSSPAEGTTLRVELPKAKQLA
jgi:signal transduction histidine kinase